MSLFLRNRVSINKNKMIKIKIGAIEIKAWLKIVPVNNLPRLTQVSGKRVKKVIREIKIKETKLVNVFFR